MQKSLERQIMNEFKKQLAQSGIKILIQYQSKKITDTNVNWTNGDQHSIEVKALRSIISFVDFKENKNINIQSAKNNFYVPYGIIDLSDKKNIRVEYQGRFFDIDRADNYMELSNGSFLALMLVQK